MDNLTGSPPSEGQKVWWVQYAICLTLNEITVNKNIDRNIALIMANMILSGIDKPGCCVVDTIRNTYSFVSN